MSILIILILMLVVLPICIFIDQLIKRKDKKQDQAKKDLERQKELINLEIAKEKLKEIKKKNADL